MRTIAIYFTEPGFMDYPFNAEDYRQAYEKIGSMLQDRGGQCFIVRGDTYQGKNTFARGWKFINGKYEEYAEPFRADVVFNKGRFPYDKESAVINEKKLDDICTD